jgi:hypothetical protein
MAWGALEDNCNAIPARPFLQSKSKSIHPRLAIK